MLKRFFKALQARRHKRALQELDTITAALLEKNNEIIRRLQK